jgi:mRNA interferase HicA
MKHHELHRLVLRNGWIVRRQKGSHVLYEKDGRVYPVPNHGSKEVPRPLELKIKKEMALV